MAHNVQPASSSSLEPLEPRLLLSADLIGMDVPAPLQTSLGESAINIDLDQQDERLSQTDPSLILTYLASTDISNQEDSQVSDADDETTNGQLLIAVAPPVETDAGTTATLTSEAVSPAESGVQIAVEPSALAASSQDESTSLANSDQTDVALSSETEPIENRGPPAADSLSVSNYETDDYNIETESFDSATAEGVLATSECVAPQLPGLYLIDPNPANLAGQIVYLDFDGEAGVSYNGPVTIGPFDIPAFQAPSELAGQDQLILAEILAQLEQTFAGSGVIFTTQQPDAGTDYSSVYIGGDDAAFQQYGSFFGVAEQTDESNCEDSDSAFVFSECAVDSDGNHQTYGRNLAETISHEVGHLLGYAHLDDAPAMSSLSAVASVAHPHILFDPINAYEIDPSDGNSIIEAQDTDEFLFTPMASGTAYFAHGAEGLLSGIDLYRQQASTWTWVGNDGGSGTSFFAAVTAANQYKLVVSTAYSWVDIDIDLPTPLAVPVQLDANGDKTYYDVLGYETTGHYYKYVAPAAGTLLVSTSTPAFGPDTDLFVFDANGNMVFQSKDFADGYWYGTVGQNNTYYILVRQNLDEDYTDVSYSISFNGPSVTAPWAAVNPNPTEWATNQSINVDLSWSDGGGATAYDVYFGTDSTPDDTPGYSEFKGTQTGTSYDPGTLAYGTTYYWRIDARNSAAVATGNVWSFTTAYQPTQPPSPTVNPNPSNGATNQSINVDLSWANGGGATAYDVYFGTDLTPDSTEFRGTQSGTTYDPGTLAYNTTYYWKIDARNSIAVTTGTVWSFTTASQPVQPPSPTVNPSPSNGATNKSIDVDLSWANGGGATAYDVYFGTDLTPDSTEFRGTQSGTTYDPGTLAYNTTYYWKIDARNSIAVTTGTVWSFTTSSPVQAEIEVSGNGIAIADGDTTPSPADHTDFGSVFQGQAGSTRVFTVRNAGTGDLTLGSVSVPTGFTVIEPVSASLAPGASDTFTIRLDTAVAGTKTGDVSFSTNDADENPFNFRITGTVQQSDWLASPNVPMAILDFQTILSTLSVSGLPGVISDVDVLVNITHTWGADLDVYLISPIGTRVELFTDVGPGGNGFHDTILDDEASTAIESGTSPFAGSYRPEGFLAILDGENPNGTWQLEITDDADSDAGILNGWALRIGTGEVVLPVPAEQFGAEDDLFDLQNKAVLFTPGTSGYAVSTRDISSLPTDPAGGTTLPLGDDSSLFVALGAGKTVPFYGTDYVGFYVGSNGYITFTDSDRNFVESLPDHFEIARISALFDDLDPSAGGVVSWKQLSDRVVVTWQNVPEAGWSNKNTLQVEIYFDGRIQLAWLGIASQDSIVGLSDGLGLPLGFEETDFSKLPPPASPINIALNKAATQSSTYAGAVASRAVDGNTGGNWSGGSLSCTTGETQPWWQVDLGGFYEITTIEIWNRTDGCQDRLDDFYVFVSGAPIATKDPAVTANQVGIWSKHVVVPGGPRPDVSMAVNAVGRYIRIQLADTNYLTLAEVRVFGVAATLGNNVAQGKIAAQSSTYAGAAASRAADGNTNGAWSGNSLSCTTGENQPWWQVDLGGFYEIDAIEIWNRTDGCQDRLDDFYVFVSDNPFTSTDPVATASQAGVWSRHVVVPGGPRPDVAVAVNRAGRYVRIQLADTNYLTLAEVKVFGRVDPNVARRKTATQSSTYMAATASRAVDGNTNGAWPGNSLSCTAGEVQPWWQVDLGGLYQVDTIEIWNRTDQCQDRLDDFYVFVSNTPLVSRDPVVTANQAGVWSEHLVIPGGPRPKVSLAVNTVGRYVRIQLADTNYLTLAEVRVLGTAVTLADNVAQGKSASQSSTYAGAAASRAVDGNTNGAWSGNSLSCTAGEVQPWWQVDLGGLYQVDTIEIWNRTDGCQDRLDDFYVFVSNTPFTSTTVAGTLAQAGVWSQHVVIPDGPRPDVSLAVGAVGRYVRIQLAGTNYLTLAEVKVFGTLL